MKNTLVSQIFAKKKGVALITVVGVTFFMSLMTATLVATHSANFALMLDSANQKQAYLSAASGLDYAKFRLSQERTLGTLDAGANKLTLGDMEVTESSVKDVGATIKAVLTGSVPERSYTVTIGNYLSGGTPTGKGYPANCVVIKVHGVCGTFQASTETVLVEAPLYDSAAISNDAMDMSGVKKWTIDSTDPLRNWIRSNQDIEAPDFFKDPTAVSFLTTGGCPLPGVAWSKKEIGIGKLVRDASGKVTSTTVNAAGQVVSNAIDGTNKDEAFARTHGQMAPHATLNYNAYDLKLGDLNRPNKTAEVEIPAGDYDLHKTPVEYTEKTFTWNWDNNNHHGHGHWTVTTENKVQHVNDLVYTPPGGAPVHKMQDTASAPKIKETPKFDPNNPWQSGHEWQNGYQFREITITKQPANIEHITADTIPVANGFTSPELTFTFPVKQGDSETQPAFKATSALPLHVSGDFIVRSNKDPKTLEPPAATPNFSFAKPGESAVAGNFGFLYASEKSLKPTATDNNPKKTGDTQYSISLQGTVEGKGAVAATGDLTLGGSSKVEADIDHKANLGLVLWSGRNITFDVEDKGNMAFKGLIYGKKNVELRFKDENNSVTTGRLTSLQLEGALVAQSGAINMKNSDSVAMKYNNEYLKLFTNGLPENTARFAQVSFKIF